MCETCTKFSDGITQQTQIPKATSIPASYLQLLDARIAELESAAAEASRPGANNDTLFGSINGMNHLVKATKPTNAVRNFQSDSRNAVTVTTPTSIAIERYLKDETEPDGV